LRKIGEKMNEFRLAGWNPPLRDPVSGGRWPSLCRRLHSRPLLLGFDRGCQAFTGEVPNVSCNLCILSASVGFVYIRVAPTLPHVHSMRMVWMPYQTFRVSAGREPHRQ
jgi:hypothetical protein